MSRMSALVRCVFLMATLVLGLAGAARPMMAPSTGAVPGDYDVNPEVTNPSGQPSSVGSEFFRVEWAAGVDERGRPRLSGYVYDDYGQAATHVQLQISAVDAAGHEIHRVTRPVAGTVPSEGRAYFDVPVPPSQSYQVTVVSFDFVEGVKS
jgi:hypothetical protein